MPGVQISQLPILTIPDGTEVFPVEKNGVTKQLSIAVLAAAIVPFTPTGFLDAQLAAGLNSNVDPPGYSDLVSILKLSSPANAAFSVDGIQAPASTKFLFLLNVNTTIGGALTIVDSTASVSVAGNRIITQAGAGVVLLNGGGVLLWYDPEAARWRVMG